MTAPTRVAGLLGAAFTTLALAAPATAAEPSAGTVDSEKPVVEFTGESTGSAIQYGHFFYGAQLVDECVAPVCDSFTVTVGEDGKKLVISAEDATGYTEMQVKDAAGNEVFYSTGEDAAPTVFSKSNPKKGTVYTVEVLTDALAPAVDDGSFFASATFTPVPPPPPAEPTEPAPSE